MKLFLLMAWLKVWHGIKLLLRITFYGLALLILAVGVVVWQSGDASFNGRLHDVVVNDITELNPVAMAAVVVPQSVEEIVDAVSNSSGPIAIGGGRYSQGGQTAIDNGVQIDMRDFDDVVSFSPEDREVTVQAGITWRELQEVIDPHDLSVKIMQTYANFTVGGSVSVNVHGRYIGHGPIISSVLKLRLVLADGQVVVASRAENAPLFYAAVGGYGGVGVIAEVTLELAENTRVERQTQTMPITDYARHFAANIRDNENVVFHNADIYPPAFEKVRDVSWFITDDEVTIEDRLIATDAEYTLLPLMVRFTNSGSFGKWTRRTLVEPVFYSFDRVAWRNWEASYDVRELGEPDRSRRTWVLQEYFIPVENFDRFVPRMRAIFQKHDVDVVNVSIRHALPDPDSYLSWARREVFAFVVYHSQGTTADDRQKVGEWTREMIDAIIAHDGSYYLPYQPHATPAQFRAAYPNADLYFSVKRQVDPQNRFQNRLWKKYYPDARTPVQDYLDSLDGYAKGEEQTFLTVPEWYLVFNPNEYADFLERGNSPSDFPFLASIDEYWSLYDRVKALTDGEYPQNSDYELMLWVIGVSTTAEFLIKGAYENTIGRLTQWLSSGDSREEEIIREAHRAYATLIFDEAWYQFPFMDHVDRIWQETDFFGSSFIRKTERKLMFTAEFAFKALYARAIAYGAQQAYEPSDGLVTAHVIADSALLPAIDPRVRVLRDFGDGQLVVTVPRWGGFTEIVPKLAAAGVEFLEISGNDEIVISTTAPGDLDQRPELSRFLFSSVVVSPEGRVRDVYVVNVRELASALNSLPAKGITLEHIYDF
ncbi:MAG: FAD-binding oxidoreductase [Pseudomonadota bacterium]